jgi:hypothetical protein
VCGSCKFGWEARPFSRISRRRYETNKRVRSVRHIGSQWPLFVHLIAPLSKHNAGGTSRPWRGECTPIECRKALLVPFSKVPNHEGSCFTALCSLFIEITNKRPETGHAEMTNSLLCTSCQLRALKTAWRRPHDVASLACSLAFSCNSNQGQV